MRRKPVWAALFVGASVPVAFLLLVPELDPWCGRRRREGPGNAPTVQVIRELAQLATLRAGVADVQRSRLDGFAGGVEADLVVRAEFTVATDLSAARLESVDPDARTAVLVLPQPTVSPPRIDHDRSHLVGVRESGLWAVLPGGDDAWMAVVNRSYADAERTLSSGGVGGGRNGELRSQARRRTEDVMKVFFDRIGWSVAVRWE